MRYIFGIFILNLLLCLNTGGTLWGSSVIVEEISESRGFLPISMTGLNPFNKIFYISFDTAVSVNTDMAGQIKKTSYPFFTLGIKHSLKNTWFLGFNIGAFNYWDSDKNKRYSFSKFSQEISYPFNVYYPMYAILGIQVGYATAIASMTKFYKIDHSRKNTLFFSGFITFLYYYSPDYSYFLRFDLNHSVSHSDMNKISVGIGVMRVLI